MLSVLKIAISIRPKQNNFIWMYLLQPFNNDRDKHQHSYSITMTPYPSRSADFSKCKWSMLCSLQPFPVSIFIQDHPISGTCLAAKHAVEPRKLFMHLFWYAQSNQSAFFPSMSRIIRATRKYIAVFSLKLCGMTSSCVTTSKSISLLPLFGSPYA